MSDEDIDPVEHGEHIKNLYEQHLADHPADTPEASHWVDEDRVALRFDVLTDVGSLAGKRILDFGCGNGLLYDYIKTHDIDCEYVGWDVSPEMVEVARERHPDGDFYVVDVLNDGVPSGSEFDYILVSGVFHISGERSAVQHTEWYRSVLRALWPLAEHGLAVNFFSEFVDYREPELHYCELQELVPFCVKKLTRWYQIRHDYKLYEFTMYLYQEPDEMA